MVVLLEVTCRQGRESFESATETALLRTQGGLQSHDSDTAWPSDDLNGHFWHVGSDFVDQLPPRIRNTGHACIADERYLLAFEQSSDQIEHFGFGVGVERDEESTTLLFAAVGYLRFDVLEIAEFDAIEFVNFLVCLSEGELVGLVEDF